MSLSPWTCLGDAHHQTKDGQDKALTRAEEMQPNSKKTLSETSHPMYGNVTIATNLDTLPENAKHLNRPGTIKHTSKTTWTKTKTSHGSNQRYTHLIYSITPFECSTLYPSNKKTR